MPSDSIITTIITMHMVMMGMSWNCGMPEMQRHHDRGPWRRGDLLEMHDAEDRRQDRACDDAEQHRDIGDEAAPHLIRPRITSSTNSAMPSPCNWP